MFPEFFHRFLIILNFYGDKAGDNWFLSVDNNCVQLSA
jgi:hypothetical protein